MVLKVAVTAAQFVNMLNITEWCGLKCLKWYILSIYVTTIKTKVVATPN
jgi:hypothetical protein